MKRIVKIGLAFFRNNEILLVRKRGSIYFILPGGKPEAGETDLIALCRELEEELGCALDLSTVYHVGAFSDTAAGMLDTEVTIKLYSGSLIGTPQPKAEIEDLFWMALESQPSEYLAPSLRNSILPYLLQYRHQPTPRLIDHTQ